MDPAPDAPQARLRWDGQLLRRFLTLLRPVRWHLTALFAAGGVLAIGLLPIGYLLFDALWTRALEGRPPTAEVIGFLGLGQDFAAGETLSPDQRLTLVRRVIGVGVGVTLAVVPLALALYYYQVWILQRVNQLLRLRLLDRLQTLSLRFHGESRIGDAIYRMYQDSAMVTQLVEVLLLTPLYAAARALMGLVVVALFDPWLALGLLALFPPMLWLGLGATHPLRRRFRRAREANSHLTSRIQETLAGIRVIKAYGAEAFEQQRFESASRRAFDTAFDARFLFAFVSVALYWIVFLGLIVAAAWAAELTRRGGELFFAAAGFTIWTLGGFNFFKLRFGDGAGQLRQLLRTWTRAQDVAVGLDRVFEILDLEPEVQDAPDARDLAPPTRGIRFEKVRFGYRRDRPVLEEVSFEAPVGSITAVVGPTGSGKTTLMALLLRLFDPERGRIEIDGVDLRRVRVASLRARAAVALQENVLFGTSVRENIRYAVPDASDEAVREAARVAGADAFIEALPQGYDTPLGERGAGLSTGQRQRLSIARAVLKDPAILILDEPTASLDAETEARVLRNLSAWARGRLVFLVTHRLSTVRAADQVLVLQEGRVAEWGSPEALLARPEGAYRRLVDGELGPPPPGLAAAGGPA